MRNPGTHVNLGRWRDPKGFRGLHAPTFPGAFRLSDTQLPGLAWINDEFMDVSIPCPSFRAFKAFPESLTSRRICGCLDSPCHAATLGRVRDQAAAAACVGSGGPLPDQGSSTAIGRTGLSQSVSARRQGALARSTGGRRRRGGYPRYRSESRRAQASDYRAR